MMKTTLLACSATLLLATSETTSALEGGWIYDINGIVMGVTPDGFLLVSPGPGSFMRVNPDGAIEDDYIKVRQWGLEIDPYLLEVVALGRNIGCDIAYEVDDFVGGECSLIYFDTFDQMRAVRTLPFENIENPHARLPLTYIAITHGLGVFKCSDLDHANFPETMVNPLEPEKGKLYEFLCTRFEHLFETGEYR